MNKSTSVRNFKPSQSSGKDARDTLGGESRKTPAQSATNVTEQSTVEKPPTASANGGWNTNK